MLKRLILGVMLLALTSATFVAFAERDTHALQLTATPSAPVEPTADAHGHDHSAESTAESTDEADTPLDLSALPNGRLEDGGFYVGEEDAPIVLIEFADWACPHCQDYRSVMHDFIEAYVVTGMARFEFRIFPTAGGQNTYVAGLIAECAAEQVEGGFWQSYDILFTLAENGRYSTANMVTTIVDELELDQDELFACGEIATQVDTDMALGAELGVSGTPAVLVRYLNEDGEYDAPEFITLDGVTYNRSGVALNVLAEVVEAANENAPVIEKDGDA